MRQLIIDTNILARFLVGDNFDQLVKARKIFTQIESGEALGEISILVIDELIWVMEGFYKMKRNQYMMLLRTLLGFRGITIKEIKREKFLEIISEFSESDLDFTDLYLLRTKNKNQTIVSFDKKLLNNV